MCTIHTHLHTIKKKVSFITSYNFKFQHATLNTNVYLSIYKYVGGGGAMQHGKRISKE